MEQAPQSKIEREPRTTENLFVLERFSPDQLAALIDLLEPGTEFEHPATESANEMMVAIEEGGKELARRDPDKADELFSSLISPDRSAWVKGVAIDSFAAAIFQQYQEHQEDERRQALIDKWLPLLDDNDSFVRDAANEVLSKVIHSPWIDAPTAQYINPKLVPHRRLGAS